MPKDTDRRLSRRKLLTTAAYAGGGALLPIEWLQAAAAAKSSA